MTTSESKAVSRNARIRDPRLEPYLQNSRLWDVVLALAGGLPYAGAEPNPRPVPKLSLYDVKQRFKDGVPSGAGPVPEALYYAFYTDRYRAPQERAITVPATHLWWLVNEGDTVLLSDGITSHYTEVDRVDRAEDRIYFNDDWPERFFLLSGRNRLGIVARNDRGLSVSESEFARASVGLIAWDTPSLINNYFTAYPEQTRNYDALMRFGFALMDAEADLLAPTAANLFASAMKLAPDDASRERAAKQAYLAAACGAGYGEANNDAEALHSGKEAMRRVVESYPSDLLESGLSPRELARLGYAANRLGQFGAAIRILSRAIDKEPDFEDAYWLRATATGKHGDPAKSAEDARKAIALNDIALAELEREKDAIDPRGIQEHRYNSAKIGGRKKRRESEIQTLLIANLVMRNFGQARIAANLLIDLNPDRDEGYAQLAAVERASGDLEAAATAYSAAIARASSDDRRKAYEADLASLEAAKAVPN
jgi:tetratricopeptide (TPR) repeat protein